MVTLNSEVDTAAEPVIRSQAIHIGLLTGGFDRPYAFGLAMALAGKGISLDLIGSDEIDSSEFHVTPRINFLNFLRNPRNGAGLAERVGRVLGYYARLLRYAMVAKPKVFHILWNNKFQYFDRTFLMLYYKALGKRITLTAHNVNAGKRDSNDSWLNRLTLRIQYRLADHIFVHTDAMKRELAADFDVPAERISVIPFGINNSLPDTGLTAAEAKRKLGLSESERTILFFGSIRPYKGVDLLATAFLKLAAKHPDYRLIVAGEPKKGAEDYIGEIRQRLQAEAASMVIERIHHIPDEETELYFKAADVTALPYKHIFQSGVLFLAYNFGLPVVAADVGAFRDDVVEGRTGFLCKPCDADDLAAAIERYFESDLYRNLESRRKDIRDYAAAGHSWEVVGEITRDVYTELNGNRK
jgi:glycosyltransferase involved in cell wall biosynthesis